MLVAAVKSFDFLLGFVVAKLSDNLQTPFGRRRPFIAICFPLGLVCFLIFCNAHSFFDTDGDGSQVCDNYTLSSESNGSYCPILRTCIEDNIVLGKLWPIDNTTELPGMVKVSEGVSASSLAALFVPTYFGFVFFTWTGTQIPYDALGMELTDDYHARTFLFSVKSMFQFVGYLLAPLVGIILGMLSTDLLLITSLRSFIFAALGIACQIYLLVKLKERPIPKKDPNKMEVPAIPSARRVLANRPYRYYLYMKVPLTLFSLVPSNMLSFFIKNTLALENWTVTESVVLGTALIGGLIAIPCMVKMSKRFGKANGLALMLIGNSICYIVFGLLPYTVYRAAPWLSFPVAFVIGLGTPLAFVIPDALLNDIIDYDELCNSLHGERNEAMFTMVETNLQQFVEIAGGVIPLMILGAADYKPLGGCDCGCGIPCEEQEGMAFARWKCPNNVGYSCTGEVESTLLFTNEPDVVPCATQPVPVLWLINFFMMIFPGVLGVIAAFFAHKQVITEQIHAEIRCQLPDIGTGKPRIDPLTGKDIHVPTNTPKDLMLEHWSANELKYVRDGGLRRLRQLVGGRLLLWTTITVGLLVAMGVTMIEHVVTLGCLILALMFLLMPWDALRLRLLFSPEVEPLTSMSEYADLHSSGGSNTLQQSGHSSIEMSQSTDTKA